MCYSQRNVTAHGAQHHKPPAHRGIMRIIEHGTKRAISIDAQNTINPQSVFLSGPRGLCMEFDRATFIEAIRQEFGLVPAAFADLAAHITSTRATA